MTTLTGVAVAAFLAAAAVTGPTAAQTPAVIRSTDVAIAVPVLSHGGSTGLLVKAQWRHGGRQYCFYRNGWRGPGYYWCGYAMRRGLGWGGVEGWNGWGRVYRNDRRHWGAERHDRDWRRERHERHERYDRRD